MRDYQESVTTGQTDRQTDAGQSDPYVPLCFAGDTKIGVTGRKYSVDTLITFKLLVGDFGFGMKGRWTYSRIPSEA